MKFGFDLKIEQSQKLVMTQELIQAIKILQLNTQELRKLVQEELMDNPLLELGEAERDEGEASETGVKAGESGETVEDEVPEIPEFDGLSDFDLKERIIQSTRYDDISYRQWEYRKDERDGAAEIAAFGEDTLCSYLLAQLDFSNIEKRLMPYAVYIIESLDENGYLMQPAEAFSEELGISEDDVKRIIRTIQSFEPAGVGAADLRECLLLQLSANADSWENYKLVKLIISDCLEELANNRLPAIAAKLDADIEEVQAAADMVRKLEPKPGRGFSREHGTKYIMPDVFVEKQRSGEYAVSENEASSPRLMVSSYYKNLLPDAKNDPELEKYLSSKIDSAIWLIKSIEQRKKTIYNISRAIVEYQKDFFEKGLKYMKPLTLKQIAQEAGVHESTVSRTVNGKYMQTPRGVFELKYFFSSGVPAFEGEGVSSESVKLRIKEMIESENPSKPLSDQYMADVLAEGGVAISRRTVAKYRDELGIASSSKRKRF